MTLPRPSLRRIWRGLRAWSFELRLAGALLGTFVVVMAVAHAVTAQTLRDGLLELDAAHYTAEARSIEDAFEEAGPGERPLGEAREVITTLARRPGVVAVRLLDRDERTIAASEPGLIGRRESSPALSAALTDGTAYAGAEQQEAHAAGHSVLEFIEPVTLGGRRFALEVDADAAALQRQQASVNANTRWVFGLGAILAFGLFYLLGGRALSRRHQSVLKRATRDPLTELGNHRAFQEELDRALSFAARHGEPNVRWRSSTSTTSSSPTTRRAIATGTRCWSRSGVRFWPGVPRIAPSASAGTSSR